MVTDTVVTPLLALDLVFVVVVFSCFISLLLRQSPTWDPGFNTIQSTKTNVVCCLSVRLLPAFWRCHFVLEVALRGCQAHGSISAIKYPQRHKYSHCAILPVQGRNRVVVPLSGGVVELACLQA